MNPSLGRNFEAMDPLEWLARISDHIPDPGQHRTLFYGEYSSRVRGTSAPDVAPATADPPPRRRCSPSWARMIAKVYRVDPLAIGRILEHLGLRPAQQDKPPPAREILRVAETGEGWGLPASRD